MADSLVTPVFRLSFPALFEAKSYKKGDPKFSATMLFDEEAQADPKFVAMKAAAAAVVNAKWPDGIPTPFWNPFRKGEEKPKLDGYEPGMIFLKASSGENYPPNVVDQLTKDLSVPERRREIYAGAFCRAVVSPFAYEGSPDGVSFGLRAIQLVGDAPSFGGGGVELLDELPVAIGDEAAPEASAGDSFLN